MLRSIRRLGANLAVAALGFVAGVLLLYIWWVQSGPALAPWHLEALEGDFTAARAAQVKDFADYRLLEERLFAELDREVYAKGPTGPEYELVRYSPGSASDPRGWTPSWNRSFELGPAEATDAVLLLHGMSDGPYSLRALGESLAKRGYRVLGLRLPGHGTVPAGLLGLTWEDMAAAVRLGMTHLAQGGRAVHMIGYSTGGALALDYALNALGGRDAPVPASLVLVSPAIGITPAAFLNPWIDRLGQLPGLAQLRWTSVMPEIDPFNYGSFSTNAGVQVHRMTRSVYSRVRELGRAGPIADFPPTLILLTAVDATVSPEAAADQLLKYLAPGRHELLLYDINRFAMKAPLLVADPGPLTRRLMDDPGLPFALTVVGNVSPESRQAVARHKGPFSAGTTGEPLGVAWPDDAISLSHVDLPFPPDDPLYGREPPAAKGRIFLGQLAIRGERGVLKVPAQWLLRLRHNPFYDYQERRVLDWIGGAGRSARPAPKTESGVDHARAH